jgi:hypothetical protein
LHGALQEVCNEKTPLNSYHCSFGHCLSVQLNLKRQHRRSTVACSPFEKEIRYETYKLSFLDLADGLGTMCIGNTKCCSTALGLIGFANSKWPEH